MHRALRVVLVRLGVAKVCKQPVSEILCNGTFEALDRLSADGLKCSNDFAQVLWVQLPGQRRRIDHITEEDG